jgi:hypothetical protein
VKWAGQRGTAQALAVAAPTFGGQSAMSYLVVGREAIEAELAHLG